MADASTNYSFIDVAAWDGVRENFLSGRPIAVFSSDMQTLLWANGRAAQLFDRPGKFARIGMAVAPRIFLQKPAPARGIQHGLFDRLELCIF